MMDNVLAIVRDISLKQTEIRDEQTEIRDNQTEILDKQTEILDRLDKIEHANTTDSEALNTRIDVVSQELIIKHELPARTVYKKAGPSLVNTTELLEQILMWLPVNNVLFAQGVNSLFKDVITSSVQLQRKCFFLPEPPTGEATSEPRMNTLILGDDSPEPNNHFGYLHPMLLIRSSKGQLVLAAVPRGKRQKHKDDSLEGLRFEKASLSKNGDGDSDVLEMEFGSMPHFYVDNYTGKERRIGIDAPTFRVPKANGSWQRMYLTQPTCEVSWRAYGRPFRGRRFLSGVGVFQAGSTVGELKRKTNRLDSNDPASDDEDEGGHNG